MFQLRNKLNDEQSNKLSAQRELLFHKKEEASKMDQRIQELQQRIKKRRSQQQVQQQQQNKNILNQNKYCGRPQGTNVAAVEPYVQQVIKDTAHDDLCKNTGFMKKDPKYQSLPSNTKFTPDKNSIGEPSRELNNNEQTEDKQLPSGVHSDFYRRKLESNGPKSGQSTNGSLSVERLDGLIPTGDQSAGSGKENKVCSASNQGAPKFNVTNIAKYAPRAVWKHVQHDGVGRTVARTVATATGHQHNRGGEAGREWSELASVQRQFTQQLPQHQRHDWGAQRWTAGVVCRREAAETDSAGQKLEQPAYRTAGTK